MTNGDHTWRSDFVAFADRGVRLTGQYMLNRVATVGKQLEH